MRILWMTLECILPANTGGRIGVFKRLEQMTNRGHEVYLFSHMIQISMSKEFSC